MSQRTNHDNHALSALPTLVKKLPVLVRKIIGDLSNTDRVLVGLDITDIDVNGVKAAAAHG